MNYFQKKSLCAVFYWILIVSCIDIHTVFTNHFILGRIHIPTSFAIEAEASAVQERKVKKYLMAAASTVGSVVLVYSLSCIRKAALQSKDVVHKDENKNQSAIGSDSNKDSGILNSVSKSTISLTDFIWDFSKFFADAGTIFAAGVFITFLYESVRQKLVDMYQKETVSWFITHQTKLKTILSDLKKRVIAYDLHSELLSSEMYHVTKEAHLEAFVTDICQGLSEYKHNGLTKDPGYYNSLIKKVEKKYKEEFNSLEDLQTYVVPILSMKKRNLSDSGKADLFNRDNQLRIDVAFLCDLFIKEFTRILAFIQMHQHQQQLRVSDLVDMSNQFIDHMELMLNLSKDKLDELSKNNSGFFTVVYEYEKLFDQQILLLDQYCNLTTT